MSELIIVMSGNPNSIGGVETYNFEVVKHIHKSYRKITIIYTIDTPSNNDRVWPSNVHIEYRRLSKKRFFYLINILKVKIWMRRFKHQDILLHSYYYLAGISKKNRGRITQIQHSTVEWIVSYVSSNLLRKILFTKGTKLVNYIIRFPGSDDLLKIFKNVIDDSIVYPPHCIVNNVLIGNDILWAGRLENKDKNYDYAIEVAKCLPWKHFNFWGDGDEKDVFIEKISHIKNITYRGPYNTKMLNEIFIGNYLQIITSNREGFPIASLEARMAGLKVLCRDTFSSAKDLRDDGIIDTASSFNDFVQKITNGEIYNKEYNYNNARILWENAVDKIIRNNQ